MCMMAAVCGDVYPSGASDRWPLTFLLFVIVCTHAIFFYLSKDLTLWTDKKGVVNRPGDIPAAIIIYIYSHVLNVFFVLFFWN